MVPQWVILWGVLNGVEGLMGITAATLMQDLDQGGISALAMTWHVMLALLWTPAFLHEESFLMAYAILFRQGVSRY
jgi:hypothetical protein